MEVPEEEASSQRVNTLKIKDLDGNVRFTLSGPGLTQRQLLKRLVSKHSKSKADRENWKNLDLRGLSFHDLDLFDFDFTGSDFTNANLSHCEVDGSTFTRCLFDDTSMSGMKSERQTKFNGAIFRNGTDMYDTNLVAPNFRAAQMNKVFARKSVWKNPVLSRVVATEVDLSHSKIKDGDWGRALITKSDFENATIFDGLEYEVNRALDNCVEPITSKSLPNRMRGAIFVGNKVNDQTRITRENGKLIKFDRFMNIMGRTTSSMAITSALAVADVFLGIGFLSGIENSLSLKNWIMVACAVDILKNGLYDPISSKVKGKLNDWFIATRKTQLELLSRSYQKVRHLVMIGKRSSMGPLIKGLEAVKRQRPKNKIAWLTKYVVDGDQTVVVCDQRHLAEALAHISSNRRRGYKIHETITLARANPEEACSGIPSVVSFNKDGTTTLTWHYANEVTYGAVYDHDGELVEQIDISEGRVIPKEEGVLPHVGDLFSKIDEFEKQIIKEGKLEGFAYDKESCYVVAGKDGTILVHKIEDRKLHNNVGPAIVQLGIHEKEPTWQAYHYFLRGKHVEERDLEVEQVMREAQAKKKKMFNAGTSMVNFSHFLSSIFQSKKASYFVEMSDLMRESEPDYDRDDQIQKFKF